MSEAQEKIKELIAKKEELERSLMDVETRIFNLETTYLEDTGVMGNIVKGWDSFLTSRRSGSTQQKMKMIKPSDRIFSNSSVSAQSV